MNKPSMKPDNAAISSASWAVSNSRYATSAAVDTEAARTAISKTISVAGDSAAAQIPLANATIASSSSSATVGDDGELSNEAIFASGFSKMTYLQVFQSSSYHSNDFIIMKFNINMGARCVKLSA